MGLPAATLRKMYRPGWPRHSQLVEYMINQALAQHNLDTREGKLVASHEVITILAEIENAVERDEYIRYAAGNCKCMRIHCVPM